MRIYSTQFLMNQFKAILSDLAYPLTITGRAKRYLNDCTIYGNSVQEGTPSPDAPAQVLSVGDLVTTGDYAGKYKIPVTVTCGETTKTTEIYLDAPLRKIGEYADYIDFKGKRAVRRVKEVVVTGTEYWSTQGDSYANDTTCFFASGASFASGRHTLGTWASNRDLCNMLPRQSRHPQASSITTECFGIHPTESLKGYAYFRIKKSRLAGNTAEAFKAWLKDLHSNGTPMKVYYALEESVNEAIELPKVLQFKGQNTYTVETTITPSGLQVKYY